MSFTMRVVLRRMEAEVTTRTINAPVDVVVVVVGVKGAINPKVRVVTVVNRIAAATGTTTKGGATTANHGVVPDPVRVPRGRTTSPTLVIVRCKTPPPGQISRASPA
jgi:hypothetical protein